MLIRISSYSRWLEGYGAWSLGQGVGQDLLICQGGQIVSKETIIIKQTRKQVNKQTNADVSRPSGGILLQDLIITKKKNKQTNRQLAV